MRNINAVIDKISNVCFIINVIIIILGIFQGAGHNDVELYNQYLERLKQFVSVELIN